MVFFATYLLAIYGLKIIGGVLLIWIGVKLCLDSHEMNINVKSENRLLAAVKTIIIADFVMSFDNSLAIAAAADGNIYIVIFGLLLSVPIIIFLFMHFWSKLSGQSKNRVLMIIFGIFFISIFVLLFLLMN